jgi:hypothetical protein
MPSGGGSDVESCLAKELEAQGITVDPADYARLDPMAAGMLAAAGHEDIVEERAAQAKLEAYRDGFARAERRRREEREADADSRELDLSQSYILDARGRMASLRVGFSSGTWSASVSVRGGAMSVAVDGLADGEAEAVARRVHGLYEGALGQC